MYFKVISVYILGFSSIFPEIWTTENDTDSLTTVVYLDPALIKGEVTQVAEKQGLRYGFQKTEPCQSFQASFVCIRKCLDLGFDVAYADRKCKCTCYTKPGKSKYFPKVSNVTSWKKGYPSTRIPEWATPKKYTLPNTTFPESSDEDDEPKVTTKVAAENSTPVVNGNATSGASMGSTTTSKVTVNLVSNSTSGNVTAVNGTANGTAANGTANGTATNTTTTTKKAKRTTKKKN